MKRSEVALAADRVRDKIAANTNQNRLSEFRARVENDERVDKR